MSYELDHNGIPVFNKQEDSMDYYFVVDSSSDAIDRVVQRTKGAAISTVSGKKFVKADGVMMKFYYNLTEAVDTVTLTDVMSCVRK